MIKNGAVFAADAIGQEQGVDKVHKVYEYR